MNNESEDKLKGMSGRKSFSVPENYFEQLSRDIETRIAEEYLKALSKSQGFTVPDLYFEQLNKDINTGITEENLKRLSKGPGYTVPDFYFEGLSSRIEAQLSPATENKPAKVVRLWNNDLLKYAGAACFIIIAAFGLYLNNRPVEAPVVTSGMATEQLLLDIDEQMIMDDVEGSGSLQASTTASDQELEAYILSNYSSNDIAANL